MILISHYCHFEICSHCHHYLRLSLLVLLAILLVRP
jgi:hypothetical protein